MKNISLLFYFMFCILLNSFCQPTIQWQKCLGGSGEDNGMSIQQTTDGGYIVAGRSISNDGDVSGNHGADYWVVKLTVSGAIQWQKCLGGSDDDLAYSIRQTTDGGYIVAGWSYSNNGDVSGNHDPTGNSTDYWIVKLDGSGAIQWQKCLGGTGTDIAYSIQQTTDGGYIVAGYSLSNDGDVTGNHGGDYWIVKLDGGGTIQWQKCLGGTGADKASSIQQTADGGYIVAGYSSSNDGDVSGNHGSIDCWIVKLTVSGAIQWQKSLGGSNYDLAYSIQQTTDGGYIVAGNTDSNDGDVSGIHGSSDYWILKLNSSGSIQWQKCLGGSDNDLASSIEQTKDGGYIVAGESGSNDGDVSGNHGGSYDYWVVKLDGAGTIQWQKCLGGSIDDEATSIQQTTDGGYIVAGESNSNNGDITGNHGDRDYWIVKLSPYNGIDENNVIENVLHIYPNPLTSSSILQLNTQVKDAEVVIYDMLGKEMLRKRMNGNRMEMERGSLESGVYFVRVRSEERQWVEKMVIE